MITSKIVTYFEKCNPKVKFYPLKNAKLRE